MYQEMHTEINPGHYITVNYVQLTLLKSEMASQFFVHFPHTHTHTH
jgi:hypothetical protein